VNDSDQDEQSMKTRTIDSQAIELHEAGFAHPGAAGKAAQMRVQILRNVALMGVHNSSSRNRGVKPLRVRETESSFDPS